MNSLSFDFLYFKREKKETLVDTFSVIGFGQDPEAMTEKTDFQV